MYGKRYHKDPETNKKNKKKKVSEDDEETTEKRERVPKSRKREISSKKQKETKDVHNSKVTSVSSRKRTFVKDPPKSSRKPYITEDTPESSKKPSITEDSSNRRSDSTSSIEALVSKMMRQNQVINQKIDKLQLTLDGLVTLESSNSSNNLDQSFIENIVKKVAKMLFKTSIYPTQDEFYDATREYLHDNHENFISGYSERKFKAIYEKDFYKPLIKQHRSFRGTLSSRIKEAVFSVFGEVNLPTINMAAPPGEILKWKSKPSVKTSYKKLFKPIKQNDATYMHSILRKVWPTSNLNNIPDIWIAYAVGITEILLNPNIQTIQASESRMNPRLKKYLKVVDKLLSNEVFSSNSDESSGSEIKENEPAKEDHEIDMGESTEIVEGEKNEERYEEGNEEGNEEGDEEGNKEESGEGDNKGEIKNKETEDEENCESEDFIPPKDKVKLRKKYKGY